MEVVRAWVSKTDTAKGSRLPPERKLAEILDLSRPELRKALAVLENEGRIYRHVGRGTFLTEPAALAQMPMSLATLTGRTGPYDAMTARITLEPELAQLAALHATPLQISETQALNAKMRMATTWDEYEQSDHALHDLIAKSAGNILLHELHRIMNAVRRVVVWREINSDLKCPPPDYHSFDEHDAIIAAIANRDGAEAKTAMRSHLRSIFNTMTVEE
jgi:DNA-binding FadR family transcriptional regulator|tara:strand:- start:57 stop:710 length:654 start_codon:yes stop_codon:yes gene_type:complete